MACDDRATVIASFGPAYGSDATFIAHARSALPAALDEIERLRVALEDARAALRGEGGK